MISIADYIESRKQLRDKVLRVMIGAPACAVPCDVGVEECKCRDAAEHIIAIVQQEGEEDGGGRVVRRE